MYNKTMKQTISILIIIILFSSCKSTKSTVDNKLDIQRTKIDNTVKVVELAEVTYSFDEILIVPNDPNQSTTITDNKGITKSFTNVKSISIKSTKESLKTNKTEQKNDIKDMLIDKSEIKEANENISDANNFKSMFMYVAIIFIVVGVCYLVFKFKR